MSFHNPTPPSLSFRWFLATLCCLSLSPLALAAGAGESPHALALRSDTAIAPRLTPKGRKLLSQAQADEAQATTLHDQTIPRLTGEQSRYDRHERMRAQRPDEYDPATISRDRMEDLREAADLDREAALRQDDCTSFFSFINREEYCNEAARLRRSAEDRRHQADRRWTDYDEERSQEAAYQAEHRQHERDLQAALAEMPRLLAEAAELRKVLALELVHPPGRVAGRTHVNHAEAGVADATPSPAVNGAGGANGG